RADGGGAGGRHHRDRRRRRRAAGRALRRRDRGQAGRLVASAAEVRERGAGQVRSTRLDGERGRRHTTLNGADAPLRRDVRLLGETLGHVLVEQGGEELLADEERIRVLSRRARAAGSARARAMLAEAVAALPLERQAEVLRAFSLYFQLANLAEQHHRLRRRREYEHEQRIPRESLADAFVRLERAGITKRQLAAAG